MKKSETGRILDYLKRIDESINGPRPPEGPPKDKLPLSDRVDSLSDRVDKLDTRVSEVQFGLATLAASTTAQFKEIDRQFKKVDQQFKKVDQRFNDVDARFDKVDRSIESARIEVVDLVERVHAELTGRLIDVEVPEPGGRGGGGRGSGGSGMPLAS